MHIIGLGEILWDVFEEKEFLGGAPLNFSATAQRLGNHVALLTGVGQDERGDRALKGMESLGLGTGFVQTVPDLATGTALVVMDDKGNASYAIPRPAAFDGLQVDELLLKRMADLHPDWIYFGTLAQTHSGNESIVQELLQHTIDAKCFYDMNLRTGHWEPALVERLSGLATILKLNESEAEVLFELTASANPFSLARFCELWSTRYGIQTIVVTLGGEGCAIFCGGTLQTYPGIPVQVVDTIGAGDAFSAAFLHGYQSGWPISNAARFANAVGAIVASRAGATPDWTLQECLDLARLPSGDTITRPQ